MSLVSYHAEKEKSEIDNNLSLDFWKYLDKNFGLWQRTKLTKSLRDSAMKYPPLLKHFPVHWYDTEKYDAAIANMNHPLSTRLQDSAEFCEVLRLASDKYHYENYNRQFVKLITLLMTIDKNKPLLDPIGSTSSSVCQILADRWYDLENTYDLLEFFLKRIQLKDTSFFREFYRLPKEVITYIHEYGGNLNDLLHNAIKHDAFQLLFMLQHYQKLR